MKKNFFMIIVLLFALSGCDSKNDSIEKESNLMSNNYIDIANISEFNDNSYMGMELYQDSGLTDEESKNYGGDFPYVICPEEGDIKYYCFRYPNDEAPLSVTQIQINDEEYNVFGICIGTDIASGEEKLRDNGYSKEQYDVENTYMYCKGDVQIILKYRDSIIERIVVSLKIQTDDSIIY